MSVRIGQASPSVSYIQPSVTSKLYFEPCGTPAKAGVSMSGSFTLGGSSQTFSLTKTDVGAGADSLISVGSIGSVGGYNLGGIYALAQITGNPDALAINLGLTACTGGTGGGPSMNDCLPNPAITLLSHTFDVSSACPTPAPTPAPAPASSSGNSASTSSSSGNSDNSGTTDAKDADDGIGAGGIAGAVIASIAGAAMIAAAVVYKRKHAIDVGGSQQAEPAAQVTQSATTGSNPEQL